MSESTIVTSQTSIGIAGLGTLLLGALFVLFLVGAIYSVKYVSFRKTIGASLIAIGIIEILPFLLFICGLNDIGLLIPFIPLIIIFLEGCVTSSGGLVIFFLAKLKKQ